MIIKCISIDDEYLATKVLESHLNEIPDFKLIASFSNPLEAISTIENEDINVIFIDINMPKMNGLDFIKSINTKAHFVITTAHREFAAESYDLNVVDYLLKPIAFSRFLKATQKIKNLFKPDFPQDYGNSEKTSIFIKVDKKHVKVKFDDIFYVESLKDYVKIFTKTGNYLVHKSLTSLEEELPTEKFLRIHRSFLISLNEVEFIEGNSIQINKKRIPIGRKYAETTKNILLDMNE
ncbi:LytR/AlgR family response regulator transcription factor [Namhaeicola litoreus]|uniref:LytR/AlgR family response regulator transcription factor n=1 Tax=Namhaeicola litoreus TaxID=1052145 RepID=A0ABW3Y3N2_9FLAO